MLPPPTDYQSPLGVDFTAGSGAVDFHALAGAAEECVEVVSARVCRSATGVVRRVCHVADHHASLRVGGDVAFILRRIHVLIAHAGPGSDRGVAGVLVDDGEREATLVGLLEEFLLTGVVDDGADVGGVRGGDCIAAGAECHHDDRDDCECGCEAACLECA